MATTFPVATGSNRTTSAGVIPAAGGPSRTASIINFSLAAGTTVPIPSAGDNFYFILLTSPIQARPSGGVFNDYQQGTGLKVEERNQFALVELKNDNPFPVAVSIFVGFGGYIDNRVILANGFLFNVANPLYAVPGTSPFVQVKDLSGTGFTDINGKKWIALARQSVVVCNLDTGSLILLGDYAGATGNALAYVQPLTSIALPLSGDFSAYIDGTAPVNGTISEIYQAIEATS